MQKDTPLFASGSFVSISGILEMKLSQDAIPMENLVGNEAALERAKI